MVGDQDIKKILSIVVATKADVDEIKQDVRELKESNRDLVTAIDNLAKAVTDLRHEYAVITVQLDRHERWIKEIAEKAGVKLTT